MSKVCPYEERNREVLQKIKTISKSIFLYSYRFYYTFFQENLQKLR